MAVGKRLRFQIFRRDNFACRYCGLTAAGGAVLEVDHIKPQAEGGKDHPTNLITACEQCNSGKSDIPLDAALVEDVPQADFRLALVQRGFDPDPEPDGPPELAEWVHDLDIAAAVRWYNGQLPHPREVGRYGVSFHFAVACGHQPDAILAAAEAAGSVRDPYLHHYLPDSPTSHEEPHETAAFREAEEYLKGFIAVELVPLLWRARQAAGDYTPTYREMVLATASFARQYVEDPGRDREKLEAWLRWLPNGEGSKFRVAATADWDAHWQGERGHSAHESPDEVLELAVSLALNTHVPHAV
jgi:hypothetical protein